MMSYTQRALNDKSLLTDGWHPAFLVAITDEPTPESWKMFKASPRMWRWQFVVWSEPSQIGTQPPERQSAPSSQSFTPKGTKNPASKAYQWTTELLARQIQPGESVDLDPLMPLPCRVKISRNGEYANIIDLELWREGQRLVNEAFRQQLRAFLEEPSQAPAPVSPAPPQHPGMVHWSPPVPQSTAAPAQPSLPGTPPRVAW